MSVPLRLALTSFYLPSESKIGAGWMAHRLADALADLGHDVTMFSPSAPTAGARYTSRQISITGSNRISKWALVCRRLDLAGFDALIAQGDDHLVKRRAVPVHLRTMHGSCFDEARVAEDARHFARMVYLGLTEALSALRTPTVVGVSENSIRFYPWHRTVVPNGVDTTVFHPDPATPKDERPTLLFVGTYERRKRGRLLMEVFEREVRPKVPDARLWMVCDDAPGADGVEVLGRLSDDELADRYRGAWVFCLPSTHEGFGVPYVEAMVSGTAVVSTPNRGARELLGVTGRGQVVSDDELGTTLVRLLTDAEARRRYEQQAQSAAEEYSMRAVAERYVALVRERQAKGRR